MQQFNHTVFLKLLVKKHENSSELSININSAYILDLFCNFFLDKNLPA